jgi:hypothetical protein
MQRRGGRLKMDMDGRITWGTHMEVSIFGEMLWFRLTVFPHWRFGAARACGRLSVRMEDSIFGA